MISTGTEALVVERLQSCRFGCHSLGYLGYLLGLLLVEGIRYELLQIWAMVVDREEGQRRRSIIQ
jgi:hypothetical protein